MAMLLKINDTQVGSGNPCPVVTISQDAVYHPVTGAVTSLRKKWDVNGVLLNNGTALATQVSTLESLVNGARNGTSSIALYSDTTKLAELTNTGSLDGVQVSGINYPKGDGIEWATKREYSFSFSVETIVNGSYSIYTQKYSLNGNGITQKSVSGTLYSATPTDAAAKLVAEGILGAESSAFSREFSTQGVITAKSIDFTMTDTYYPAAMPTGCCEGSYDESESTDDNGIVTTSISGSFTSKKTEGSNVSCVAARTAADALITSFSSGVTLKTKNISENPLTGTVSFSASYEALANNSQEYTNYKTSYQIADNGVVSKSVSGTMNKNNATKDDAKTFCEGKLGAQGQNISRSFDASVETNADGSVKTVSFTMSDTFRQKSMPAGCCDGSVTKSEVRGAFGANVINISGSFTARTTPEQPATLDAAKAAMNAVLSTYNSYKCLSKETTEDEYNAKVSFTASYLVNTSTTIEYSQTVVISEAFLDYILIPVLDGGVPIKQYTVKRPAKATQTGHRKSTHYHSPDRPIWNDVKDPQITYNSPELDLNNRVKSYEVSWSYSFEFPTTPSRPIL